MPWSFYDKFEANDERKSTIIDSYTADWGEVDRTDTWWKGPLPLKYTSFNGDGPGYAIDAVVFRLAEVYLSVAEAINEQRGPSEAYAYVNEVRRRSNVSDFEGMTTDEFRDAILDERGRELCHLVWPFSRARRRAAWAGWTDSERAFCQAVRALSDWLSAW